MTSGQSYWQDRLSRRRALRGGALGAVTIATATALACASSKSSKPSAGAPAPQSAGTSTAEQPRRGGTFNFPGGVSSNDTSNVPFDPHTQNPLTGRTLRLVYQGLLGYDFASYAVTPELAQKWEQPSQTEYLFHLQPGVKWQNKAPANGRELTADDVVFSLNRVRTNEPLYINRAALATLDKIEASDKATVRITTKEPDAVALSRISGEPIMILAPEVVEKAGKFATPDVVVGTGPYMVTAMQAGVSNTYQRNPTYWKQGFPRLDELITVNFKDDQSAWAAFLAGQVHVSRAPGTEVKGYIDRQGAGYSPKWYADDTSINVMPNVKAKPMDDARVAMALRLLMDHNEWLTAWANTWFGRGRLSSILPTALSAWDLTDDEYRTYLPWKQPKDEAVKTALAMLSAAGHTKDNPLKFTFDSNNQGFTQAAAELLQAQWKRLGQGVVDANLRVLEYSQYVSVRAQRQFTYTLTGAITATEPDPWFSDIYGTNGGLNFAGFSDPQFDALVTKQRAIFDPQQRKAAVKDVLLYMIDHYPGAIGANRVTTHLPRPLAGGHEPDGTIGAFNWPNGAAKWDHEDAAASPPSDKWERNCSVIRQGV